MMNRVDLVGRLTKDPELRRTANGNSMCLFTLAVDRRFKTPGQPEADFIPCVAWSKTADNMCRFLHKGSLIAVEGRIQTRSYDNPQGVRVYVTEVVAENVQFLESRRASQNQGYGNDNQSYGMDNEYPASSGYRSAGSSRQNSAGSGYDYHAQQPVANSFQNTYNSGSAASSQPASSGMTDNYSSSDMSDAFDDSTPFDIASDDLPF